MRDNHRYTAAIGLLVLGASSVALGAPSPQGSDNSSAGANNNQSKSGKSQQTSPNSLLKNTPVSGEVSVGAYVLSNDSYKFGEWTGLKSAGVHPAIHFEISQTPNWKSTNPYYWKLKGSNLGLESRSASAEAGKRGAYKFKVEYRNIPHYEWHNAQTPYTRAGKSYYLRLPHGFGGLDTHSDTTWNRTVEQNLNPNLHNVNLHTYHRSEKFSYTAQMTDNWSILAQFKHIKKTGRLDFGSAIAGSGANPATVLLPKPIDYRTNQVRIQNNYQKDALNISVAYLGSFFNDTHSTYSWDSPYTYRANAGEVWDPSAYYQNGGLGRASTAPDNMFNQGMFSGSWSTPFMSTSLIWDAAYGVAEQNATLMPYTVDPSLKVTKPLPTSSAHTRVDTTQANFRVVTSPVKRMEVVAAVRYNDHADHSHRYAFYPVVADASNQSTSPLYNLPYSYRTLKAKFDAQYSFGRVRPFVKYQYERENREYAAVSETRSHHVTSGLHIRVGSYLQMRLSGHYGTRNGSYYRNSYATQLMETGKYNPAGDTNPRNNKSLWTWNPLQEMFWFANRNRVGGKASIDITPPGPVSLSLDAKYNRDHYNDTTLGLQSNENQSYSLDISYTPSDNWTLSAYGTFQRTHWDQSGIYFPGYNLGQAFNFNDYWHIRDSQPMYFAGINLHAKKLDVGLPHPIDVAFNANYSYTSSGLKMTTGSALASSSGSFPDLNTRLIHLGVTCGYQFTKKLRGKLGFVWQHYHSHDWHYSNMSPGTIGPSDPMVSMGLGAPNYTETLTTVAMSYRF